MKNYNRLGRRVVAACSVGLATMLPTSGVHGSTEEANSDPSFIILGPAITPEFMGSEDYSLVPMLVSEFAVKGFEVEIEGPTAQVSLFNIGRWQLGVTGDVDMGRDDEVENLAVSKMQEIDPAFNLGGYVSYQREDLYLSGDSVEIKLSGFHDTTNVHDGMFATFGVTYALPLYIPWRFEFEFETTFADDNYMQTYFGVSEEDSFASGLQQYNGSASIRDITLTANTTFFLSPRWGLFSRLSGSRLLGDAADSPITKEGSKNQVFVGLGIFYRF